MASSPSLLILGQGMLGRAWRQQLEQSGRPCRVLSRPDFDLAHPSTLRCVEEVLATREVRAVVNCAAWTDVDGAESHEAEAHAANAAGVAHLAIVCRGANVKLIHYSTDYVFDGSRSTPYPPDAPRHPINAYGRSKAQGEELLEGTTDLDYLLIRTSWLYAPWGRNFVRTIVNLARQKSSLQVVADQRGRPTSAPHLAAISLALLDRDCRGMFHVTDRGDCTWYDFACQIVNLAGLASSCQVQPCTSREFPRPAPRPASSMLDLAATEALLGPMPGWQENLAAVMAALE